ncbi:MAG TPA: hypothetical protein VK154_02040 [Chitinophagales bacterium]|nr:hypothetical protein [Chitinophagales bacterium]
MKTSLSALHHQTTDWQRELAFYSDEMTILNNRLQVAKAHNQDALIASQLEDFEKQLNTIGLQVEQMKKDMAVREGVIENMTEETMGGDDTINTTEDVILEQMKNLVSEIANIRFFFNLFLSRLHVL